MVDPHRMGTFWEKIFATAIFARIKKEHKFYLEIKILNYDDAAAVFRLWKFSQ